LTITIRSERATSAVICHQNTVVRIKVNLRQELKLIFNLHIPPNGKSTKAETVNSVLPAMNKILLIRSQDLILTVKGQAKPGTYNNNKTG
jgi:hypothetical protein